MKKLFYFLYTLLIISNGVFAYDIIQSYQITTQDQMILEIDEVSTSSIYQSLETHSNFYTKDQLFKYNLELNLIQLDRETWDIDWLSEELKKVADIYSQVSVKLHKINVITWKNVASDHILYTGLSPMPMFEEMMELIDQRIALCKRLESFGLSKIYVWLDRFKDPMRYGKALTGELAGTLYLSAANPIMANPKQGLIAHEIAHILFEEGHNFEHHNILNDGMVLTENNPGNIISERQNKKLPQSPYLKSIID